MCVWHSERRPGTHTASQITTPLSPSIRMICLTNARCTRRCAWDQQARKFKLADAGARSPVSSAPLAYHTKPCTCSSSCLPCLNLNHTKQLPAGGRTRKCAWNQHARLSRHTLSSAGKSCSVPSSARYVTSRLNGALHCGHHGGSLCTAHARMHLPARRTGWVRQLAKPFFAWLFAAPRCEWYSRKRVEPAVPACRDCSPTARGNLAGHLELALQFYGKYKLPQAPAGRLRALRSCTLAARRARQKPSMLQTLVKARASMLCCGQVSAHAGAASARNRSDKQR